MILILDNIRSLHNVGSILRTADGAGFARHSLGDGGGGKVYLCGITPSPLDRFKKVRPEVAKTALGAEKTVPWEKVDDTDALIEELKKDGYQIVAVEQAPNSIPYYKLSTMDYKLERLALVFGHEVDGVSKTVLEKADKIIEIPMSGTKESLNVSISVGIILFHFRDRAELT